MSGYFRGGRGGQIDCVRNTRTHQPAASLSLLPHRRLQCSLGETCGPVLLETPGFHPVSFLGENWHQTLCGFLLHLYLCPLVGPRHIELLASPFPGQILKRGNRISPSQAPRLWSWTHVFPALAIHPPNQQELDFSS